MVPAQQVVPATVARLIAAHPHSAGKVEAAWHVAVGGALARLSRPVRDARGVIYVSVAETRVASALEAHRRVIEGRLRDVLGADGRTFVLQVSSAAVRPGTPAGPTR